jgi:hypothetical protein
MQQISGFKTSLNSYLNLIKYKIQVHLITQFFLYFFKIIFLTSFKMRTNPIQSKFYIKKRLTNDHKIKIEALQ